MVTEISSTNATDFYNNVKDSVKGLGANAIRDSIAARVMTEVCTAMSKELEQTIADQNDYLVDVDSSFENIANFENEMNAKIKKLQAEIDKLKDKREAGTLSESEENELQDKLSELMILQSDSSSQVEQKNEELYGKMSSAKKNLNYQKVITTYDYSETAIEKGNEICSAEEKNTRKFGNLVLKTDEYSIGEELLNAGNELFEKAETSCALNNDIYKKSKRRV